MLALVGCPFGTGRIELSQVQSSRPTGASACHDPLHPPTNRWIRAQRTNAIANMAFLDWAENAKIRDSDPVEYLPVMVQGIPADRLARQVKLHALPIGWEQLEYQQFLEKRRLLIARVIRDAFASLSSKGNSAPATTSDLIASGEGQTVEFKSTARLNLHTQQADPKMEHHQEYAHVLWVGAVSLRVEGSSEFAVAVTRRNGPRR